MGLMQIMPKTYAGLRARHLGPDAYNPRDNILAGAAYLRGRSLRLVRVPHNAGPARYDEHWRPAGGRRRRFFAMLSPMIGDRQSDDRTVASFDLIAWARATLFATHPADPAEPFGWVAKVQPDRLPSVLHRIVDLALAAVGGSFVHLASGDRPQ